MLDMRIIEQNVLLLNFRSICKQIIKQGNNAPTLNVRIQAFFQVQGCSHLSNQKQKVILSCTGRNQS